MPAQVIKISGARQHNLKNIHVELPREKLVVITGLSGSGKSSLAFDTLYAERQRRYKLVMPSGHLCCALADCAINFVQNFSQTVAKFPSGIVFLKSPDIADPPDVVADPVRLFVAPG